MLSKPAAFKQAQEIVRKYVLAMVGIMDSHHELYQSTNKAFVLYPLFFNTKPICHWIHKDFKPLTDIAEIVKTSAKLIQQLETVKKNFITDYEEVIRTINKQYPSKNIKGEDYGTRTMGVFLDTFDTIYNELKKANEEYQSKLQFVESMAKIMNGIALNKDD